MFYWLVHFENKILINYSFTQWKWAYILNFGHWWWSALNMGYMDKWPWRMQAQCFFQSRAERATVFNWDLKVLDLFCRVAWRCRITGSGPYPPPLKVHRGRVSVRHGLRTRHFSLMQPLLSLGICMCRFSLTTTCTRSLVIIVVIGGIP